MVVFACHQKPTLSLRHSRRLFTSHHFCRMWAATRETRRRSSAGKQEGEKHFGTPLEVFVLETTRGDGLAEVFGAFQGAVKQIARRIRTAGLEGLFGAGQASHSESGRDAPKKLDTVANSILKDSFTDCGRIAFMASEEDEDVVEVKASSTMQYAAVFDPLDGSSNIDACIPVGTILGVYPCKGTAFKSILRPGREQVAAAYALYSSATMLVLSVGNGVWGFTLDPTTDTFRLTHHILSPRRGQMYSLNDARQDDWPHGLRTYIDNIRQGKGQTAKQYAARYVCSLVADFHRTLLYGGWAGNPRSHLRLVYEANPLSFLAEQAGGRGTNGKERILDLQVGTLHQRGPLFMGSSEDIAELESYGEVQQLGNKKYSV